MSQYTTLQKARARMLIRQPFFAQLALRLRAIETHTIETMGTDGRVLLWNPDFVDSLTREELECVLAHEVMHCALNHHTRRGKRDPQLWNVAGDYAINLILVDSGMTLPDKGLIDRRYAGMSTEQIYAKLVEDAPPSSDGGQDQSGDGEQGQDGEGGQGGAGIPDPSGMGVVFDASNEDGKALSSAEKAQEEIDWNVATNSAASAAKIAGKLPGGVDRLMEEINAPAHDWREQLRAFLTHTARDDYSWSVPNRRTIARGLYLPGMRSESMPPVAVVIDTSGSIGGDLLSRFTSELNAILEDTRPELVTVIDCDARVNDVRTFEPYDLPITFTAKGGGGTAFAPALNAVAELENPPACLIYLTDMWAWDWEMVTPPDCPVLWCDYAHTFDGGVPFGEHIKIDV